MPARISLTLLLAALLAPTSSVLATAPGQNGTGVARTRYFVQDSSGELILRQNEKITGSTSGIKIGNDVESKALELTLAGAALPPAPVILGIRAGDSLDAAGEIAIGWERPGGETEDLYVFVELQNETGEVVYSSPRLSEPQVLRAGSSPLVLPPNTLVGGQTLKASVTFFKKVEDIVFKGLPVTIGTASQTELTVATSGTSDLHAKANGGAAATNLGGVFQLKPISYSVGEAAKSANIVISRTGGSAAGGSVSFQTVDGSGVAGLDYLATNGTVIFKKGEAARTIPVSLIDDTLADGTKTFQFKLVAAGDGATLSTNTTATVTIKDNDVAGRIAFSAATFSTNEAAATAFITLKRTGGTASGVKVDYWTQDGTAVANHDYQAASGTVVFGARDTVKTFSVPLINNNDVSSNKTVKLKLGNFAGGALPGTITNAILTLINDDSSVSFTNNTVTSTEGSTVTLTITRAGALTTTGMVTVATVAGTATAGTDFTATNFTVVFPPKTTTRTVKISILNDSAKDGGEIFHVVLRNPTGGMQLGAITDVSVKINDAPDPNAIPTTGAPFFKFSVNGSAYTSGSEYIVGSYESTTHFLVVSGTQFGKSLGSKVHMMLIQNFVVAEPGTYQVPSPTFAAVSYQRSTISTTPTQPDFYTTLEGKGGGTITVDNLDLSAKIVTGRFDVTLPNSNGNDTVHVVGSFRVPLKKAS